MTLELEYICTEAERKEAQSLQMNQHYGGGSRWRARTVVWLILAVTIAAAWFRFKREIAPGDRGWFVALVIGLMIVVIVVQRFSRREDKQPVRLEVTERELIICPGNGRTRMLWSAFSECLESPNLFVLLDRPKAVLYVIPKRAFPDESAQAWFRAQANQPRSTAPSQQPDELMPGRFVSSHGIALSLHLKLRDYLNRNFTSWRMRGIALLLFALVTGMTFLTPASPNAVNSSLDAFAIEVPILTVILLAVTFFVSLTAWRAEKKYLAPQHLVLTGEGIEFADNDSSGRLPWSTYRYYKENRWSFFVWNPRGSLWLMFPKRSFATRSDQDQCREFLKANLSASRWFYL